MMPRCQLTVACRYKVQTNCTNVLYKVLPTANHESSSGKIPNELFRSPAAYMNDGQGGITEHLGDSEGS